MSFIIIFFNKTDIKHMKWIYLIHLKKIPNIMSLKHLFHLFPTKYAFVAKIHSTCTLDLLEAKNIFVRNNSKLGKSSCTQLLLTSIHDKTVLKIRFSFKFQYILRLIYPLKREITLRKITKKGIHFNHSFDSFFFLSYHN